MDIMKDDLAMLLYITVGLVLLSAIEGPIFPVAKPAEEADAEQGLTHKLCTKLA
jgi:hypothetical protein